MAIIGQLTVNVVARTEKAVRNMDRFRKTVRTTGGTAQQSAGGLSNLAGTLAKSALVIGAVTIGIRKAVAVWDAWSSSIDKLNKSAKRLGFTTQALSAMQHVADQTGVSLDTITMASQRMTRRIAEAAKGTGEAKNAIKELGLAASDLNAMRPEEQLRVLADALKGVSNQADRVRLAMKLFDSEGVKMLDILAMGGQKMRDMEEEAKRLGLTINEDLANSVTALRDNLDRFGKEAVGPFRSMRNYIAEKLLPVINETIAGINAISSGETRNLKGLSLEQRIQQEIRGARQRAGLDRERTGESSFAKSMRNRLAEKRRQEQGELREAQRQRQRQRRLKDRQKLNEEVEESQKRIQQEWADHQRQREEQQQRQIQNEKLLSDAMKQAARDVTRRREMLADRRLGIAVGGTQEGFSALRANRQNPVVDIAKRQLEEAKRTREILEERLGRERTDEIFDFAP